MTYAMKRFDRLAVCLPCTLTDKQRPDEMHLVICRRTYRWTRRFWRIVDEDWRVNVVRGILGEYRYVVCLSS